MSKKKPSPFPPPIQLRPGDLPVSELYKEANCHGYTMSAYLRHLIKLGRAVFLAKEKRK